MIDQIAFALGRNDEVPNIELAINLCNTHNTAGVSEIVDSLNHKDKRIAKYSIKI